MSPNDFPNQQYADIVAKLLATAGMCDPDTQLLSFMRGFDRLRGIRLPYNHENYGYYFITRPRLNLQSSSVRQSRILTPLDTENPNTIPFMIRCYLDPYFCKTRLAKAANCPGFDYSNPFLVPLTNAMHSCTGWQDPVLQTYTTDPGFHSEDQTFVIGSDNLNRTYTLNLGLKDVQYAPVMSLISYWMEYIRCQLEGIVIPYADDINMNRMNYSVSIYHFGLDVNRKYITRYAKATGCFPVSYPEGATHNMSNYETYVSAATNFTVPFIANKIEYNDPAIIMDFRRLIERYAPNIADVKYELTNDISDSFGGIPWIINENGGMFRLVYKNYDEYLQADLYKELTESTE
jgi:hypothetical protein